MISRNKFQKKYQKYISQSFDELLYANIKVDRRLLNNYLRPFIIDLQNNGISKPNDFCSILKRHKVLRNSQKEIIKGLDSFLKNVSSGVYTRGINHSNTNEKNILFTYCAFHYPESIFVYFNNFISTNLTELENKDELIGELCLEINKITKNHHSISVPFFNLNSLRSARTHLKESEHEDLNLSNQFTEIPSNLGGTDTSNNHSNSLCHLDPFESENSNTNVQINEEFGIIGNFDDNISDEFADQSYYEGIYDNEYEFEL